MRAGKALRGAFFPEFEISSGKRKKPENYSTVSMTYSVAVKCSCRTGNRRRPDWRKTSLCRK